MDFRPATLQAAPAGWAMAGAAGFFPYSVMMISRVNSTASRQESAKKSQGSIETRGQAPSVIR